MNNRQWGHVHEDDPETFVPAVSAQLARDRVAWWNSSPFRSDSRAVLAVERIAEPLDLIELLRDEQQRRCAYGAREGDGRTCDCKYDIRPMKQPTSETTGCPELRAAIRALESPAWPSRNRSSSDGRCARLNCSFPVSVAIRDRTGRSLLVCERHVRWARTNDKEMP